jgi:hypothetical protein
MLKDSGRVDFHTGQPEEVPNAQDQRREAAQCNPQTLLARPLDLDVRRCFYSPTGEQSSMRHPSGARTYETT